MLLYCVGFGLYVSWLWLLFLEGPLLPPLAQLWQTPPNHLFLLFLCSNALGFYVLGYKVRPQSLLTEAGLQKYCAGALSLLTFLLGGLPLFSAGAAGQLAWAAYVLTAAAGLAAAPFMVGWMELFTHLRLVESAAVLAGAVFTAGSFTLLGGVLKVTPCLVITALLPVFSLLIRKRLRHFDRPGSPAVLSAIADPFSIGRKMLFALVYTAGGLMFKIVAMEQTFSNLFCVANIAYVAVAAMAALLVRFLPRYELGILYRPTLPLLGIGFLLFFSKWGNQLTVMPFLLLQAGFALFDMYTWLLVVYVAKRHARPAAVCSIGLFLITVAIFGGNMAFTMLNFWWGDRFYVPSLALTAGILSLLSALVFSNTREDYADHDIFESDAAKDHAFADEETDAQIPHMDTRGGYAINAALTEREKEVLSLLIKGRSARVIGETLNVSANTVKFHIKNIYEKTGVKNRQTLLDLFEKQ